MYRGRLTYPDGTVLHEWLLSESSALMADMCREQRLPSEVEAKSETRRREILGERLLLNHIFGVPTPLLHDSDMRPYLADSDVHITVAHTRGCLCIGLNHEHKMGVDVECYGRHVRNVRDFFLTEQEQQWIGTDDELANLIAWTAKEAIFKAVGERALVGSYGSDITLQPFTPVVGGRLLHKGSFKSSTYWLQTDVRDDFLLTYTCQACFVGP